MPETARIGVPHFLNTKPLIAGLAGETGGIKFEVSEHPPSALSGLMLRERIDVSLLPAADLFSHPGFRVLKGICISSSGEVGSVMVFSRKPMNRIQTVAIDSSSSSSAAMLRVALETFNGAKPVYEKREYGNGFFRNVDAGLVIGNRGLSLSYYPPPGLPLRFDLGKVWTEKTGLPFVYAVFAVRPGFDPAETAKALKASKDRGMETLVEIAKKETHLGICEKTRIDYLTKKIGYNLGEPETEGLKEFGRLLSRLNGTDPEPVINFYD